MKLTKNLLLALAFMVAAPMAVAGTVEQIHQASHVLHTYVSDAEQYGVSDKWVASLRGDCEDYALYVQKLLDSKGIDSQLWIVRTETGEAHAVLVAGEKVIDSRFPTVKLKQDLGYKWIVGVNRQNAFYQTSANSF